MLFGGSWQQLVLALPAVLVAITFHEYAHGFVANLLGDPTGQLAGRLSPEPWAHIDWFGLLALLFVGFGWAKPMPVDPRFFRRPRRDMMLTGAAGPVSNFVMAFVAAAIWVAILHTPGFTQGHLRYVGAIVGDMVSLNIAFGIFNLIPIPPLDGSRVLAGVLPATWVPYYYRIEPYGIFILLAVLFLTPLLQWLMVPLRQGIITWMVQVTWHWL